MIKFNVNLPEDLHRRFKVACVQQGKDMTEIVRACILKYVEQIEKKQKK